MKFPKIQIPITEIPLQKNIQLFIKREDLVHPTISGNKYWKLFHNFNHYQKTNPTNPLLITFGGAFSNHIAATAALGKDFKIPTLGIIRGEELQKKWQENPTLSEAQKNGMTFWFVTREDYRNKEKLTKILQKEFPESLLIPEGGSNNLAVLGIENMLTADTKNFDFLCSAVGTGGTLGGISKFAQENQKILGFKAVNDYSLEQKILEFSNRKNFALFDAHNGSYGKITNENVTFINDFYEKYKIPLDPIYTGKMMEKLFQLIEEDFFLENSKILAFHTGGLQGISGANELLKKQNRELINFY